ncbi:amino acid adenylation domain-containing protein (plasmid) [Skermanella mucosa]|uniref:non-ribosomal peptide synthetase n=1 Tax=Skermanella mucosa TaxID=1789672 RepID=UPI001E5FAB32|nr:non-ribosomal peptide synthetase [Skermanella mucosa]UEM24882.1 amino acid adenylation domain-containing protein [Skermanella mucosa]
MLDGGDDRRPADDAAMLPLTRVQLEIYVEQKFNPESPLFNIGALVRISGPVDGDRSVAAMRHVAGRAAAFRTVMIDTDDGPRQRVLDRFPGAVDFIDLGLERDPEAAALRFMESDMAEPLPFGPTGPLARFAALRCGPDLFFWYGKFHHIIADGWGTSLFHANLVRSYNQLTADGTLPPLELGHVADQIAEERRYRASPGFEAGRAYWESRFPALPEPLFRQNGPFATRATRRTIHLDGALYGRIRDLAEAEKASPFHVLLAALGTVLSRQCATRDLVIAAPILNRRTAVEKQAIGLFASVSPLWLRPDGLHGLRALVGEIRAQLRRDYRHQRFPIGEMKLPGLPEETARNRLHEVSLSYERHHYGEQVAGCTNRTVVLSSGHQNQPLQVFVRDFGDHDDIAVDFDFNESYFDHAGAEALVGRFRRLLESALDQPDRPVASLPWLDAADQDWLVREVNAGSEVRPTGTLTGWFEATAAAYPDRPALSFEDTTLSYADLDARSNRLARHLAGLGVGAETPVGLCLERGAELIVGLLAILKAGGCYVPLDPAYPADRLSWLAEDGGLKLVLTHAPARPALAAALGDGALPVVDLADAEAEAASLPATSPGLAIDPDQAAYVIYTSGSTGRPKGCVVSHRNVTRLMAATEPQFGFGPEDVWTLFHSYAFDFSVWEIWGALLYGGKLVVVPYWVSRAPDAVAELLEREGVTVLNQTPSAFRQLIPAAAGRKLKLRRVVFGGEALELASLSPWYAAQGDAAVLVNMYGITETTIHVTYRALEPADAEAGRGSEIGRPLADLQVHLLDHRLEPVPVGVVGEIYVGGGGVARGYRNRPDLTAERFLPDPFGPPGSRLYRSGDLARRLVDGSLEYLGRADQQVKVRGFRIEPGEIEAALVRRPGVREALVLAQPGPGGDPRLVAYVAAEDGRGDVAAWRAALAETLPDYMVPAAFVVLERFPLTHHGKIDRAALPAPESSRSEAGEAPATPAERALAAIWSDVLGVPAVNRDDNFFALGGDSILSLQVVARARKQGIGFGLRDLYRHQTLRGLAASAMSGPPDMDRDEAPAPFALIAPADRALLPAGAVDAFPMSRLQAGMLFHAEMEAGTAIFHDIFSYRIELPWRDDAWDRALETLADANPALRTSLHWTGFGEALQVVHGRARVPLEVDDLRALDPAEREDAVAAFLAAEKRTGFDLAAAPLFRVRLHRLEDEVVQVTISFHHAILDGWSVATLLTRLISLYLGRPVQAGAGGTAVPACFVALEKAAIADEGMRRFWAGRVSGLDVPRLPRLAVAPPAGNGAKVSRHLVALPDSLSGRLAASADRLGAPIKSLALAAHLRVLAFATGRPDAVTGYVTHGRPELDGASEVTGLFLNTVPLRLKPGSGTWRDLVRDLLREEAEVLTNRRLPTADIKRLAGGIDLYEAGFNFIHFHVYAGILGMPELRVLDVGIFEETDFPFLAQFARHPTSGELELTLIYDHGKYSAEQIAKLGSAYISVMEALADTPDADVAALDLLGAGERDWLVREANAGAEVRPTGTLAGWFEATAAAHPDRPALGFESTTLSYAELDARSNRLARHLAGLGVGAETPVGLCLERGAELIVGLLAILKAGGCYVPLDPAYPADRLSWLAEDGGLKLVLTHAPARPALAAALGGSTLPVVDLADAEADAAALPATSPGLAIDPDQAAYVIYTSGSTGRPKGCVVSHRNVTRLMAATEPQFGFGPEDVWTLFHSYAFDFSVWEIWGALLYGGKLVVVPYWVSRAPDAVADLLEREGVTVLNQTPSAFRQLIPAAAGRALKLRRVVFGGEALELASLSPWYAAQGDAAVLVNMYGITETTVHVTYRALEPADTEAGRGSEIGRPLADLQVHLLDHWLEPVPVGVVGEIYVGGGGVARGYRNRPDLTAERFLPDPFGPPGSRLYRSGDLARRLADGSLEYLGRADQQVKVRGFRIEPGEIEAALVRRPGVREALVLAQPGPGGDPRLVAYVAAEDGRGDVAAWRAALAETLPDYMVPAAFVVLERFPLTHHGKIDRAALPMADAAAGRPDYLPPRSPIEITLAEVAQEVLGMPEIGVSDDFFALGGDSIQATRFVTLARRRLGLELPLRAVFEHRSIAALAVYLEEARAAASAPVVPIRAARRTATRVVVDIDGSVLADGAAD